MSMKQNSGNYRVLNLKEFLAKQLNDYGGEAGKHGVIQKTFTEWSEEHICDAICLGICYMYSLMPGDFTEIKTHTVTKPKCVFDFSSLCSRFINLVSITSPSGKKQTVKEKDSEIRSLTGLLGNTCYKSGESTSTDPEEYSYDVVDGTKDVLLFTDEIPAGSVITYVCSKAPTIEDLDSDKMCQYHGMIADYALWWLFRTDSESRSNLERARLHFEGLRDFVTTKLLIEFSLREDDYSSLGGRRKVDDN